MKGLSIFVSIVLAFPLAGGLAPLAAPPGAPTPADLATPPLPQDLSDADLVLLLARHAGIPAARPLLAPPPEGATVASLALALAHRSGAPDARAEDFAAFADLDPRVAGPLVTLLAAIGQAWDLRDQALAAMPADDQRALAGLVLEGRAATPEALALAEPLDRAALLEAAILLLDAAESLVTPQLQEAARHDAWPAEPLADPLGILRLGGTGDDHETLDRLVQIDPRGHDIYENNAGGTTLLADLNPETLDYPIAVSLDFEGDDVYSREAKPLVQGAGFLGIGILWDFAGNDGYDCSRLCQASSSSGVGILRDSLGNDVHLAGESSLGSATLFALLRDDAGADTYHASANSGGFGFGVGSTGILWERAGTDKYQVQSAAYNRYGWALEGGRGFFADEGPATDFYASQVLESHGCNDCTWQRGVGHGLGNDASGGMSHILSAEQGAYWP